MKPNNMFDIEELERIASDSSVRVPDGLGNELSGLVDSLDAAERILAPEKRHAGKGWMYLTGVAASVTLLAGIGMTVSRHATPEDTFTDPALAYAEVEKALASISEKMNPGVSRAASAERTIEEHTAIIDRLYR